MTTSLSKYHNIDPSVLRRMYQEEYKSIAVIAQELDVAPSTILVAMMHRRIPRRRSGGNKWAMQPENWSIDEATLRELYVEKSYSIKQVAEYYCSF